MSHYQLSVNTFNKLAEQYQQKYMQMPLYEPTYARLCQLLSPKAKVLELACGPGNIARYLLNQLPELDYLGTDLAPNMVALARANNPSARFEVMNSLDVATLGEQFDAIVCGFCLPYLSLQEASDLVLAMVDRLAVNGVIYLSTMEGDYRHSSMQTSSSGDQAFIYYHHADHLTALFKDAGCEIIDIHRQDYPERGDVDLFLLVRKMS